MQYTYDDRNYRLNSNTALDTDPTDCFLI